MDKLDDRKESIKILPKETKPSDKLLKIRYIGIEFDPSKKHTGEDEVNAALEEGYEPIRDIETPRGLIMVLGFYGQRSDSI